MKINENFLSIAKEINILEDQYIDIRGGIVFDDFEELMIILEKRSSIRTKLYSLSLDFLAKCNNNEILFKMYVQLAVSLEKEDYENAEIFFKLISTGTVPRTMPVLASKIRTIF